MLGHWTARVLLILAATLPQKSGEYPATPIEVVRQYCEFDLEAGRISTANFPKLPSLVAWEAEPGWDTVTIVSGFKILSSKQSHDRAVVTVKWAVLGHSEAENITKDQKSEVVDYQSKLVKGLWKIESPVIPPHVSLPTLRAFVLSHFQDDPKRQALWIGNLDSLGKAVVAAPASDRCYFPAGLGEEISRKYPGTHLASLEELDEHARKLYRKEFGTRCPGLVRVNFYGDGKPTWALLLLAKERPNRKAELVVAHELGKVWDIRSLDAADGAVAVWQEGPGNYVEVYGEKMVRATRPVIVISDYGSFAILYAWTGKEVDKVWLSD